MKLTPVTLAIMAVGAACHDTPTSPTQPGATVQAAVNAPGDSGAPETIFLAPLGPRARPRGILDTTLAPSVVVCRLAGDTCGADTVARFTFDSTGADSSRIVLTDQAYTVRWNVAALQPDSTPAFRLVVALGDTTVGFTDFKMVPDDFQPPLADTARFSFITERRTLRVRFQIFVPPEPLTVFVEPGVTSTLPSGTAAFRRGERVSYRFDADSGYRNAIATLDGEPVSRAGRVLMDRPHVLVVSADRIPTVSAGDEWILRDSRALLRAANPIAATQRLLDNLDAMTDTANIAARLQQVEQAVLDRETNPTALRALDSALAGHIFTVGNGFARVDSLPPVGGGGGGGGTATSLLVPRTPQLTLSPLPPRGSLLVPSLSQSLLPALAPSPDAAVSGLTGIPGPAEPATIAFVNGILTTPFGAVFGANYLARVARAARWNANVPFEVRLIYNHSATVSEDVSEQCLILIMQSSLLGSNSVPARLAECMGVAVDQVRGIVTDFAEAGGQLASILAHSKLVRPGDADSLAAIVTRWRQGGRHVIFVPHSQGNMIVQQGVDLLRQRGALRQGTDTTCVGAVSLAAPTSENWPISSRHLQGFAVEGDGILLLGQNQFPRVRTALSNIADAETMGRPAITIGALRLLSAVRLHSFVGSYLNQEPIKGLIQQAIVRSYRSCALGNITVTPAAMVMRTGDTRSFSATFADMNGEPLDGSRGVRWTADQLSDPQRAVEMSADGTVTARYVGGTSVQAVTRARTQGAGVSVDPAFLSVSAKETFSARWVLIPGMLTPPVDPGSGAPPPTSFPDFRAPWGGGTCIAKREIEYAGQTGQYSLECTARYKVTASAVPRLGRYEATFFALNSNSPALTVTGKTGLLTGTFTAPQATLDPLPGPSRMDRIGVTAWDPGGHLLASGETCVIGCAGW